MKAILGFRRVVIILVGVLAALSLFAPHSLAASRATSPTFSVTGAVTEVSSPSAYYASAGATQVDNSKVGLILTGVRYFVISGTWVKDHYEFPFRVQSDPGIRVGGMDLAKNSRNNTLLMGVGLVTSAPPDDSGAKPNLAAPASDGAATALLNLRWHDPINLRVAQIYDGHNWAWSGNYLTYESSWWPGTYLLNDGWYTVGESHYHGLTSSTASVGTYGLYENDFFCAATGGSTYISVNPSEGDGYINGARSAYVNTWASGGCYLLLNKSWWFS